MDGEADLSVISVSILSHLGEVRCSYQESAIIPDQQSFDVDAVQFIYEHAVAGTVTYRVGSTTLSPGSEELDLISEVSGDSHQKWSQADSIDLMRGCTQSRGSSNLDRPDVLLLCPSHER